MDAGLFNLYNTSMIIIIELYYTSMIIILLYVYIQQLNSAKSNCLYILRIEFR